MVINPSSVDGKDYFTGLTHNNYTGFFFACLINLFLGSLRQMPFLTNAMSKQLWYRGYQEIFIPVKLPKCYFLLKLFLRPLALPLLIVNGPQTPLDVVCTCVCESCDFTNARLMFLHKFLPTNLTTYGLLIKYFLFLDNQVDISLKIFSCHFNVIQSRSTC